MVLQNTKKFAKQLDHQDILKRYRNKFYFPKVNRKKIIYFTGNSLGLQPKCSQKFINEIMNDWKKLAVEGHFYAKKPWWDYHEQLAKPLAKVVGAFPEEITVMNTLTINLHLLMVSFYHPTKKRYKILCEEKAFSSDQYMLASQIKFRGLKPQETIVELKKRKGETFWRTEDILQKIEEIGQELALVFIGGVNYYNGQVFDIKTITQAGHNIGAKVGWDLAHAAGNVTLDLHNWGVDFAAWCSYKYMNAGPGNASGVFIHKKHLGNKDSIRFEGWWGTNKKVRFLMKPESEPIDNADAWQVSNAPVLALAPYLASLQLFDEVNMDTLVSKSKLLTDYLEFILIEIEKETGITLKIITPKERGCQLSIHIQGKGKKIFDYLTKNGVSVDWREPNAIRLAPVPFYTSFKDIYKFGQLLKKALLIA
jgi:kynureninase